MAGEISRRGGVAGVLGAAVAPTAPEPAVRPNVLVIMGDDLGWGDLSCYGSPHIRTPHLDQLAAEGIRFTHAYSAAAVCSPTRFALYTGRCPGRLPGGLQEPIGGPNELHGIPPEHPTLGSLLRQAGYTTAMFGKWHCGFLPWFSPARSGWDTSFGNFGGALDYYSKMTAAGPETSRSAKRLAEGDRQALVHNDGGSLDTYRRMVEAMDAGGGRVLGALRESGKYRDMWPARVQPRRVSDVPVITQDWTATILDVTGTPPATSHPLDGRVLTRYLVDDVPPPESDLFWRTRSARALRRGRWKFLREGTNPDALYDLSADPRERANLARRHPQITSRLSARWDEINGNLLPYP